MDLPTVSLQASCAYRRLDLGGEHQSLFHPVSSITSYSAAVTSQISPPFLSNDAAVTLLHLPAERAHLYHLYLTAIALELLTSFSSSQNKS